MRMSKANKAIAKRGTAFLLSCLLCIGGISTNWLGFAPGSSDGITAQMSAYAAGGPAYEANQTYYDAGTFTLTGGEDNTGWNISNATSVLTDSDAVTLGNTTDVNTSASDNMTGQGFGDANKNLSDYMAPVPSNETYQYIAKGTTVADGDSIKISWEIKSWPQNSNAATFPTTSDGIGGIWDTEYANHAPEWVSGNEDYFQWSREGNYNNYVGTEQKSEFTYGSNFLVWDNGSGTGATTWDGNAWSVINTIPVEWGVTSDSWDDDTGAVTPSEHVAAVSAKKGISVTVNGTNGTLSEGDSNNVAGFTTPKNLYTGTNDFAAYLNEKKTFTNEMSSWTLPAYDTAGILYSMYASKNNGTLDFLEKAMTNGATVTKAVPGTTGFTPSSQTLSFDSDNNLGLRIYGIQSAVFANPGNIWYGLADNGKGGKAYRGDPNCTSVGFSADDMPWETGKYRYPAITEGATGKYLQTSSYVHAYMTDGRAAEFVWMIDAGDLVSGTNQGVGNVPDGIAGTNGIMSYSDISGSDSPMHKTRLYTEYDGNGYRTTDTNLDGVDGEETLVNSHVPMQVRSILYYDVTDDSMRATGTAEGSRTPDKVLLSITNTTASDVDNNLTAHADTSIQDEITYTGLESGKTYELSGKVVPINADNTLGAQVSSIGPWTLTANDGTTSAKQVVTGDAIVGTEGSILVTFPDFNSATGDYGQKKYLVQQTLTDKADNTNTDTHGDVTTVSQIVTYTYLQPGTPMLTTTAVSNVTGTKFINPAVDDSIKDTVNWSGLEPGEYYIQGQLYDTAATTTVTGSNPVKSSNFTVNSVDDTGSIEMVFPLTEDMLTNLRGKQVTVGQRLYKADGTEVADAAHVNMADRAQTVTIQNPGIETDLVSATLDAAGNINIGTDKSGAPAATTVIADKVKYTGLVPGAQYKCVTTVVYQDNGATLKSSDGKESVFSHTFTANSETASFSMGLKLTNMQNDLYGKQVVAFNELYWVVNGKEVLLKEERDLKNGRQTFTFTDAPVELPAEPTLDTLAEGLLDNNSYSRTTVKNAENAGIRDTVQYTGLTPGVSYTLTEKLYNQSTQKVIAGVDPVTQTFTPSSDKGTVVMNFTLDTRALGDVKILVGASLSVTGGDLVIDHLDFNDEDQTLTVAKPDVPVEPDDEPYIDTKAENNRGGKTIDAAKNTELFDTVFYYDFTPGKTYKLEGEVREKKDNKVIGKAVTMEFTPEKETGSVSMKFTLDTSALGGKDLVVFETVTLNGETVAFHRDLNDADQTVHVNTPPNDVEDGKITTVATDSKTGGHTLALSKDAGIRDIITYEGLISGREYTVVTTPIDKQTGQLVAGASAQTSKIKADGTSGTWTVTVPIDTTKLAGRAIVIYETVSYDGKVVCSHEDINDANQTVHVGKISTILTSKNGSKTVPVANSTTLQDAITFEGLTPGRDYVITGYIIDVTGEASQQATATPTAQSQPAATAAPTATPNAQGQSEESLNVGDGQQSNGNNQQNNNSDDTSMEETIVIDEGRRQANAQSVTLADGTVVNFSGELVATGTASFTPSAANGSVSIDFSVSTKGRNGHNLVCLEVITDNGVPIAVHADLADAQQTVNVRTAVNVQTGASPFGKVMTLISVLMMLGFGIYTAQAVINRKKFED